MVNAGGGDFDGGGYINIPEVTLTGKRSTRGLQWQSHFNSYMDEWNFQTKARESYKSMAGVRSDRGGLQTVCILQVPYMLLEAFIAEGLTRLGMDGEKAYGEAQAATFLLTLKPGSVGVKVGEAENLTNHFRQLEKYGQAGFKELQSGKIRYYGNITEATTAGEMIGRRVVREWNPATGGTRTWMETLDGAGNIRIVRPETGGTKVHFMFDQFGNFIKKW